MVRNSKRNGTWTEFRDVEREKERERERERTGEGVEVEGGELSDGRRGISVAVALSFGDVDDDAGAAECHRRRDVTPPPPPKSSIGPPDIRSGYF